MRFVHRSRTSPLLGLAIVAVAAGHIVAPSLFGFAGSAHESVVILQSADHPSEVDARVIVTGATVGETAMTEWAVARFNSAGLSLPTVTVDFRSDEECGGAAGLYRHSAAAITICNRGGHDNPPRHTLLHELAHAWSLHSMEESDIAGFLTDQGLRHWTNRDVMYWNRGAERVAEYITWGLQDSRDEDRSIWTYAKDCDDLGAGFSLITGSSPLNTAPNFCAAS